MELSTTPVAEAVAVSASQLNSPVNIRPRPERHRSDSGAASRRAIVVASLFLLLVGATMLVGAHAAIGPMLQSAADARATRQAGAVVYTMPDGVFCRQISFDNTTAEVKEGAMHPCRDKIQRIGGRPKREFAWGRH
jgi:hypothetical protein